MQYEGDIVATNFTIQSKFVPKSVFAPYKGSEDSDEFIDLKLPSTIRIQPTAFDKATYQIEDPLHVKNDVRPLLTQIYLERANIGQSLCSRRLHQISLHNREHLC